MKIISIVGPTASGKTKLAQKMIEHFLQQGVAVDLISLDSRQIYRQLPVLSGADIQDFHLWQADPRVQIFNLLSHEIDQNWSLGECARQTALIVKQAKARKHQVLLLGGTLLYHQRVIGNNELINVPPNENIRLAAENHSLADLQKWLKRVDGHTYKNLNASDLANPRRLIRKIEIALYQKLFPQAEAKLLQLDETLEHFYVEPIYQIKTLPQIIAKRVKWRFDHGAVGEVEAILRQKPGVMKNQEALSRLPLGFEEIAQFLQGKLEIKQCQDLWSLHEWQYAKRQLTFLQKLKKEQPHSFKTIAQVLT